MTVVALLVREFPKLSETFVVEEARALQRLGVTVRVEARGRPAEAVLAAAGDVEVAYRDESGRMGNLRDLAWLALRRPRALLADRRLARSLAREEPVDPVRRLAPVARRLGAAGVQHLHAHFADEAALDALRLARLLGVPYSVTAHAYDIFQRPRNLRAKLRGAAFATSGCEYTVRHLREVVGPDRARDVRVQVMGVDPGAFARRRPHPDGRVAIAVGRLVEKKGFADLLAALATEDGRAVRRLVIVGDGPLRGELEARVARLGLGDRVELAGAQPPAVLRERLEESDVLVMPCVVAADGDRDSMPVAVKEAMAMELPVVVTREVGLPELVDASCGRLVPPRDPGALAAALREVLELPADERAAMGRRGRARVQAMADVDAETAKLARWIGEAATRQPGRAPAGSGAPPGPASPPPRP